MKEETKWARIYNALLGLWLMIAPWLFGFSWLSLAHGTIVGFSIALFSLVRGKETRRIGGGWSSLWSAARTTPAS